MFLFLRSIMFVYLFKSLIAIGSMVVMVNSRNPMGSRENLFIVPTLGNMDPQDSRSIVEILDTLGSISLLLFIIFWNEY